MRHFNKITLASMLLFTVASATDLFAQQPQYKLIWKENFRGKKINEKYWTKIPRGGSDWNRHMSSHHSLYEVNQSNMILHGVVNDGVAPEDTARYITGGVYTKDKKTITYGKVEVKARLQGAKGAWPAIWMLPNEGKWPDGGEIDIMERLNHDSIAYQTVHSYYTFVLKHKKIIPNTVESVRLIPTDIMYMPWRYFLTVWCSP